MLIARALAGEPEILLLDEPTAGVDPDAAASIAPPPATIHTVAVLPPYNRTGEALLITGSSLVERYVTRSKPVTVADVLAAEVREQLANVAMP